MTTMEASHLAMTRSRHPHVVLVSSSFTYTRPMMEDQKQLPLHTLARVKWPNYNMEAPEHDMAILSLTSGCYQQLLKLITSLLEPRI